MPWTSSRGPSKHTRKANTPKKRRQWAATANSVMKRGGSEGSAVRIANAAVKKSGRNKKRKVNKRS